MNEKTFCENSLLITKNCLTVDAKLFMKVIFEISLHREINDFLKYDHFSKVESEINCTKTKIIKKVMNSKEISKMKQELDKLKEQIKNQNKEINATFREQHMELNYCQNELKKHQLQIFDINSKSKKHSEEKFEEQTDIITLQKQINSLTILNKSLQEENQSLNEKLTKIDNHNSEIMEKCNDFYFKWINVEKKYGAYKKEKENELRQKAKIIDAQRKVIKELSNDKVKNNNDNLTVNGITNYKEKFDFIYDYVLEERAKNYTLNYQDIKYNN